MLLAVVEILCGAEISEDVTEAFSVPTAESTLQRAVARLCERREAVGAPREHRIDQRALGRRRRVSPTIPSE